MDWILAYCLPRQSREKSKVIHTGISVLYETAANGIMGEYTVSFR